MASEHTNLSGKMEPKVKRKAGKKPKKSTNQKAAYLLIAPSLLLILAIAIYPVIQSFYYSLFDLRLNDPTKSATHLKYEMDLDTYLNYYPFLVDGLSKQEQTAQGPLKNKLSDIEHDLESLDQHVRKDTGDHYEKVDQLLNAFKTPSDDVAQVTITNETAEQFKKKVTEINQSLKDINKSGMLSNGKQLVGLASGLNGVVSEPNFIGFKHYLKDLTNPRVWAALWNTFSFTIISVFFEFVFGFAIALLINKAFFGRGLIRASVLIPWAVPTAVSAMMWSFLYDGQSGIIAKFFSDIGLVHDMGTLLTSQIGAMSSVILADVWKTTPYMALLLLAGLQVIPRTLYEAASIDGAGKVRQFFRVTLPLMKSSILVALLFRTLDAFRVFDLIYVLTGGGPANSTETISILAYKVMFSQTNFGDGSALAVIVFICVALISMAYVKLLGSDLLPEGTKR